jgi:hypothetical protein
MDANPHLSQGGEVLARIEPATNSKTFYHLPHTWFSPYFEGMEVHFAPETEKKLKDLSAQNGRGADELLQDALAGYFEELAAHAKCLATAMTI